MCGVVVQPFGGGREARRAAASAAQSEHRVAVSAPQQLRVFSSLKLAADWVSGQNC
jgi:hypothetical protein